MCCQYFGDCCIITTRESELMSSSMCLAHILVVSTLTRKTPHEKEDGYNNNNAKRSRSGDKTRAFRNMYGTAMNMCTWHKNREGPQMLTPILHFKMYANPDIVMAGWNPEKGYKCGKTNRCGYVNNCLPSLTKSLCTWTLGTSKIKRWCAGQHTRKQHQTPSSSH